MWNRPAFSNMLKSLEAEEFDGIVVYDSGGLFRNIL